MTFPSFDSIALAIIILATTREIILRVRRIRALGQPQGMAAAPERQRAEA